MQTVQVDPQRKGTVVAGAANGLLFRSGDGGDSWSALPFPAELRGTLHALLIDPILADTYLAAVSSESPEHSGLFRSRDAGEHWVRVPGLREQKVWSLAAWPSDPRIMAAGTEDGLYLSGDSGETWQRVTPEGNREMRPVVSIAFHPTNRAVIYVGTPHLAWKTSDGGARWQPVRAGVNEDSDIFSILVDRTAPGRVFIAACSGIYRSLNGGATWTRMINAERAAAPRTYFITQGPAPQHILYAGTSGGLIQSGDGGTTWSKLSAHPARAIAWDPARPRRILIASDLGAVLRSEDGGLHFSETNRGLCSRHFAPLAEAGGTLWASVLGGAWTQGVLKLSGSASGWDIAPQQVGIREIRRVSPAPDLPGEAYAISSGALLRTADGGRTWTPSPAPGRLTTVLAATGWLVVASDTGLFRSDDHGLHWDRVQLPPGYKTVRELVPLCPSLTGAIVDRRILLSRDGVIWHATAGIPGSPEIFGLTGIGCSGLLAATASGLLRSDDLGQSWHQTGTNLRGKMVQSVASESISGLHFAAAAGVVYQSRDGGDSWQEVAPDARMGRILQILPLAGDANRLFVLTEGRGVYELESSLSVSSQADAARVK